MDAINPNVLQPLDKDDLLLRLNKQRLRAAMTELDLRYKEFTAGRGTQEFLFKATSRVVEAAADVFPDPTKRLPILEAAVRTAREIEGLDRKRFAAGKLSAQDVAAAEYERATAEVRVLRLKQEIEKTKN